MHYLLEKDNKELSTEHFLWQQLLDDSNCEYTELNIAQLSDAKLQDNVIPLGSIPFTNDTLQKKYGVQKMNPVEIPKCLRIPKFLGRKYLIVPANQIPKHGKYFIKDATEMKRFSFIGDVSALDVAELVSEHNYVVSEPVDILAEYRVYIIHGEIYAIEYYNGNPLVLPDTNVIQQAVLLYSLEKNAPISYTIDVMVTTNGTFLTEIHPVLFAVGLYTTVLSQSFLIGYNDSLHYILTNNMPAELS